MLAPKHQATATTRTAPLWCQPRQRNNAMAADRCASWQYWTQG
jgi:hypothetical protein